MPEIIHDIAWMEALLAEEEVGHLALSDEGRPYVVPINYAFIDGKIVIHGATKGRKLEIIRKNPQCCLAVNRHPDRVKYHAEKRCHYRFHSVLVYGRAHYIELAEERLTWIKKYRAYFNRRLNWIIPPAEDITTAEKCGIIVIDIDSMTARREEGPDVKAHMAIDK